MSVAKEPKKKEVSERRKLLTFLFQVFESLYPSDEDCVEELYKRLCGENTHCSHCGGSNITREAGSRFFKCNQCNQLTYFTAGTFFDRIRAVKAWVFAICLMEIDLEFNALEISWTTGIAYDTAWKMSKKLAIVIESRLGSHFLLPSSAFVDLYARRTTQTPAKQHPSAEDRVYHSANQNNESCKQKEEHRGEQAHDHSGSQANTSVEEPGQSEVPKGTNEELSSYVNPEARTGDGMTSTSPTQSGLAWTEAEVYTDQSSANLPAIESRSIVNVYVSQLARLGQPFPTAPKRKQVRSDFQLSEFVAFIQENFQYIGRKYLQCFLSTYWYFIDKVSWPRGMLLETCLRFRTVSKEELLAYVSPGKVKIALARE